MFAMTGRARCCSFGGMVNKGAKPNRRTEQMLHHGPVTGVVDTILLSEIRQVGNGDPAARTEAQRVAMQMAWRLHTLAARRAQRI